MSALFAYFRRSAAEVATNPHARTHAHTGGRDVSGWCCRMTSVVGAYRLAVVIERRSLNDDAERANQRDGREEPEHEPIKHHRHELPVILHLVKSTLQITVAPTLNYSWRGTCDSYLSNGPKYANSSVVPWLYTWNDHYRTILVIH